jgi:NADP-dependent 3-hydroxy acid dehydrogenase YdfG
MSRAGRPVAVVTGASSGIGAATARALAGVGFAVVLGARRVDRCAAIAAEIDGVAMRLDVTDQESVDAFVAAVPDCRLLVNNAGGAKGLYRMTRALLPALVASGDGHVVTVTSVAGAEIYDNGAGYCAAKHAQSVLHRTLRGELLGQPVRLTEILPGMVETDFSLVRFDGDADRAAQVYRGITPLSAEDVADVIAFAATRPSHVNLDQIVLKPRAQASASRAYRSES